MSDERDDEQVETPGWDAIQSALERLYPGHEPLESRAMLPYALGGPDPIEGIQAYWNAEPPHWHLITFGFSELYTKDSDDPAVSGYGFELNLRLPGVEADGPPSWALELLQSLGRYVFESGHPFLAGDQLRCGGPIAGPPAGTLAGITFTPDPRLPSSLDTPHGSVQLLQVVGLTADELEAGRAWSCVGLTELLAERDPLLLTRPDRASLLEEPGLRARVVEGTRRDGSSLGSALAPSVRWDADGEATHAVVGASAVSTLRDLLRGRTRHGLPFSLVGEEGQIDVEPGATSGVQVLDDGGADDADDDDARLVVTLTPELAERIADALEPVRGVYRWPELSDFELEIVPSEITDPEGQPLETIG